MKNIVLINPPMVGLKGDVLGSNIPYIPIQLAYLSSFLSKNGYRTKVIDGFGLAPDKRRTYKKNYEIIGILTNILLALIPKKNNAICIYAGLVTNHSVVLEIIKKLKTRVKSTIIVFENSLAVTGYSLEKTQKSFFDAGADYLVFGEPEERVVKILKAIKRKKTPVIDGVAYRRGRKINTRGIKTFIKNPDKLPFPDYDSLPLDNYWALEYSHAPFTGKFVPLITSRGCPYNCNFCVIPSTNKRKWRPRSAKKVVDEMEYWKEKLGVNDFQIEDLNPTMDKKRNIEICREILKRNLKISWKIAAGTKAESLDEETLDWMRMAGCVYLSISPESGSKRVLKLMNKPFDHEHGLNIIKHCSEIGIVTQCCFVIGYPGETKADLKKTKNYITKLVHAGADEIAIFIMAPLPGSKVFSQFKIDDLDKLDFTSEWREDYVELSKTRMRLYVHFLSRRGLKYPGRMVNDSLGILKKKDRTKMAMAVRRWFSIRG